MKYVKNAIAWMIRAPMILAILLALLGLCLMILVIDLLNWAWNRGES